ncbi:exported hypothetical protein [uncultured delta proteobacterium]|uniref:Transglycosylase SLT domain-containing protein n=1 Tax=uncultured delta proteobacterium TaxID=34034 RepID=A0A212J6I1_9DELT|nr:exported hypothetical protein [uncultured delta proteobacterium]
MNTPQTSLALSRTRRTTLALSLVIFFAGLCAFGLWDNPYLPQISRAAAPAEPSEEELPQPKPLQTEREYVPAETVTITPPPASDDGAAQESPAPSAEAQQAQEKRPEPAVEGKTAAQPVAQPPATPAPGALSWAPLIARLAADGFDARQMEDLFASLKSPPLPEFMAQKAIELYGRYGKAILNVTDEDRVKFAPPDYTRIAGGMTVASGRRTMEANKSFYEGLYKRYGVPAPFIIAIMMVETGLGAEVGKQSALLALGSMSVTSSLDEVLPVITGLNSNRDEIRELLKARSDWAYGELKALIEYARAVGKDAATVPGSIYGAIGICQFMPSNIPNYAVSTNKARPTPDLFVLSDAAASVACYLSAHGWKKAQTPSAQIAVLRSYNHSDVYASTVYGVATALIAPSTHRGAESARKGGNAVSAARESARASIPANAKKAKPMDDLPNYKDLLK